MTRPFVALDVGNSRYHAAWYLGQSADTSEPKRIRWTRLGKDEPWHGVTWDAFPLEELPSTRLVWFYISVNRGREEHFLQWVAAHRPQDDVRRLTWTDFAVPVEVQSPERVGLDRLAAAAAACQWRQQGQAVVVVDIGTAITVDLVDEQGVFQGGAILPGFRAAAAALHHATDALPLVEEVPDERPPVVGRNTEAAIRSGLYYGVRGAVVAIVDRMAAQCSTPPQVLFTGYAPLSDALQRFQAVWVPDLVLRGVALAAQRLLTSPTQPSMDCL